MPPERLCLTPRPAAGRDQGDASGWSIYAKMMGTAVPEDQEHIASAVSPKLRQRFQNFSWLRLSD
jgi:hypothetical protein